MEQCKFFIPHFYFPGGPFRNIDVVFFSANIFMNLLKCNCHIEYYEGTANVTTLLFIHFNDQFFLKLAEMKRVFTFVHLLSYLSSDKTR